MRAERWAEVQRLFHEALAHPDSDRPAFLAGVDDEELRREVLELLAAHTGPDSFLDTPVARLPDTDAALLDEPDARSLAESDSEAGSTREPPLPVAGAYEVVRPLGEGGMGEVFLGRQRTEDFTRDVAIKVVKRGMDTDEVLRRFALERRILASLVHPNIAQLHDAGATADGRPYFVMEYVAGERIDAWADRTDLDTEARVRLFRAVCHAVQYAHRKLIVHRDIKPGNVLVSDEGVVKLVDFGIGRVLSPEEDGDATAPATRTQARRLTPDYASPEQLRGEPASTVSDVYALGVLLFRLLTGCTPWPPATTSDEALSRSRTATAAPRPSAVLEASPIEDGSDGDRADRARRVRRLRGDLDNIVMKAMHPEPDRRYGSAAALAEDLDRHLAGRPVAARGDSFGYRAGKFVRRNPSAVVAAAAVVFGLGAVSVTSTIQSRRVARERDKAREVRSFLLETFGASSAEGSSGDATTVRELLDAQVATVRSTYADDAELRVEMLGVLADAYHRLGLFADAEPLAREALAERRVLAMGDDRDVAAALDLLGWIRHRRGDPEEAVSLLTASVDMWRRLGDDHVDGLAHALNDLGSVYDQLGRADTAESLLREALAIRERDGRTDRGVAVTSSNLAALLYGQGRYEAADSLGQAAFETLRATVGPDHWRTFVAQSNLAIVRWVAGDHDGAAALYEDLLARQRGVDGGRNARTASSMATYANLLRARGEPEAAEAMLREALEVQEEVLEPFHPDIGNTTRILGILLQRSGRAEESLSHLDRSLQINRRAYGDQHRRVGESLLALARSRETLGDRVGALEAYAGAVDVFYGTFGDGHPRTLESRLALADARRAAGDVAAAERVLALVETHLGEGTPAEIVDRAKRLRARISGTEGGP